MNPKNGGLWRVLVGLTLLCFLGASAAPDAPAEEEQQLQEPLPPHRHLRGSASFLMDAQQACATAAAERGAQAIYLCVEDVLATGSLETASRW